jgi:DNA repair protein RAD7
LDEPEEETPATKKRKLTKAAQDKLKAKEKRKANQKGKKGGDDDKEGGEEDPYTALSKSAWGGAASAKPPVGNFETCARCEKEFTVVRSLNSGHLSLIC